MRTIISLNSDWLFAKGKSLTAEQKMPDDSLLVEVPHCYNWDEPDYREICTYRRQLKISGNHREDSLFLEFQGVNSICSVFLNGALLGEHKGGYSTFRFDITDVYNWEKENILNILVDNSRHEDVSPLNGDFSVFGGIYRDVSLICTSKTHFDLMHYGSPGVFLTPHVDDNNNAVLKISTRVIQAEDCKLEVALINPSGIECARKTIDSNVSELSFPIPEPELWEGKDNPKLYTCVLSLKNGDIEHDRIELLVGLRRISMNPDQGFFLNGNHYKINGVAMHQDHAGKGNVISKTDIDGDIVLIKEIGANAVRLSHYQHPQYIYDLCDKEGLVVWTEIPMLKLTDNPSLMENAKQQLTELILQNYHHPSVCIWGLQNEISIFGEEEYMYRGVEELHQLAKKLDPTRITASANLYAVKNKSPFNFISDIVGYNVYFGWYYGEMADYTEFLDKFHKDNPTVPLGISEYGVDCDTTLHSDSPNRKEFSEEYQTLFHETVYPIIASKPFVWGSFVWNMFDFSSPLRYEGKMIGINTKGLVTYDRKTRKDAFYFYKACWSNEPVLHIVSKRYQNRHMDRIDIKVFSNMEEVTLSIGDFKSTKKGQRVFVFENVPLKPGQNKVEVCSGNTKDEAIFNKVDVPDESYVYVNPNTEYNVTNWFETGEGEADLFPENFYSIKDPISILTKVPEAWAVVSEFIPEFAKRVPSGIPSSLLSILNRGNGQVEEELIKKMNRKLSKIKKSAADMLE